MDEDNIKYLLKNLHQRIKLHDKMLETLQKQLVLITEYIQTKEKE